MENNSEIVKNIIMGNNEIFHGTIIISIDNVASFINPNC